MKIKERLEKARDKMILKKEMKVAKKEISNNSKKDTSKESKIRILKINREKLKDARISDDCDVSYWSWICEFFE